MNRAVSVQAGQLAQATLELNLGFQRDWKSWGFSREEVAPSPYLNGP